MDGVLFILGFGILGGLKPDTLKNVLTDQETWRWLLASDMMCALDHRVTEQSPLSDVLENNERLT